MFAGIEENMMAHNDGECVVSCQVMRYFVAPVFLTLWGTFAAMSATCSCVQGDGVPTCCRTCMEAIGSCCLCSQVLYSGLCVFLGWRLAENAKELGYLTDGPGGLVRSMGAATVLGWVYDIPMSLLSYSWARYKEEKKLEAERGELKTADYGSTDLEQAPDQIAIQRV